MTGRQLTEEAAYGSGVCKRLYPVPLRLPGFRTASFRSRVGSRPGLVAVMLCCFLAGCAPTYGQEPGAEGAVAPDQPRATIELSPDAEQDEAIARRLIAIYDAIGGLEDVNAQSSSGVVTLSGEVDGPRLRRTAEQLAAALEGVVAVENEISTAAEVDTRVRSVWTDVRARAAQWVQTLPLWLIAFSIVVASWYGGAALGRLAVQTLRRARNPFVGELIRQAVRIATVFAGLMLALMLLDAGPVIGSLIGSVGLIGLAIGFAVRDVIENYLASVLLSLRQPFKPDELVSIDGREGRVLRLNSRATMLMDFDGNHVRIPNSVVYKATIVNYDRNPTRRFSLRFGVDPAHSLPNVVSVAKQALADTPGVLRQPPPMVVPDAFTESTTEILCHAWIDQQHVDLAKTRGAAMISLQAAFIEAGIDVAVPRYVVAVTDTARERMPMSEHPVHEHSEHEHPEHAEAIDVGRADPTRPFRQCESGENVLAADARTE